MPNLGGSDVTPVTDQLSGAVGLASFPAGAAAANGVSVAEVVRYVQDTLLGASGTYIPGFGFKVSKSHNLATDNVDLFTVTGKVLITLLTGEVTTVVATTTTYAMRIKTTTEALFAATTITTDAQGTMYLYGGDPTVVLNNVGTPVTRIGFLDGAGPHSPIVLGLASGSCVVESDLDAAGTGVIAWSLWYLPLEASATVVAA